MVSIRSTVNGSPTQLDVAGPEAAVDVIRDQLGLTGTKLVCAGGVCGACTIQLDGTPVAACLTPATALRDAQVTTVEGIADGDALHPVQRAFLAHDALQCGFCTPGYVVDAAAFVDRWREEHGDVAPSRTEIADALAGHLCRCGAYEGIHRAVAAACRGEYDDHTAPLESRVDGPAKVTGAARYTADQRPEGALEAVIIRSPAAAGRVAPLPKEAPALLVDLLPDDRRVRWAGQPIYAVAAPTLVEAQALARSLPLDISPFSFVVDPVAAKADDAPLVYADKEARKRAPNASEGTPSAGGWEGNVRGPTTVPYFGRRARRRVAKARAEGSRGLTELTVGTSPQLHSCFEPHCAVADFSDPSFLRVWASTQAVADLAHELAERYGLSEDRVEVIADHVGGGFGSKLFLSVETRAAVELSRLAGRPVRLVLDRREELTATGNRPGSRTDVSLLVSDDGDLEAMVIDAEAYAGSAVGGAYGMLGTLVYGRTPRVSTDRDVVTNAPPGAPFRGPGGPTYAWALEQAVDQAAHRLDRDPIALRQRWDGNQKRQALYDWARGLEVWRERPVTGSQTGRFRRGVGVAAANWLYFVDPDTEVEVRVEQGRLVATTASQDMGTGSKTVLARAVAGVFDVAPSEVEVRMGRGGRGRPHGPTSGGSRTTPSLWSTGVAAAERLKAEIGGPLSEAHDGRSATAKRGGDRGVRPVPFTMNHFTVGRGFSAALHVSEVEVDTWTGRTRVLTVHGGLAIGTPHARPQAVSQCEGSIIQGIGLALYENQVLDPHTGLTLTSNLEDYRIPQLGDVPEITIHFHEDGWDRVPGGGIGLGEVATISPAASVANAVFNATGWRPTEAPVRPDRVLEGLRS